MLLIPFELIFAFALVPAGNTILPFAGIVNICVTPCLLMMARGNLIKMLIEGIIVTPVYLLASSSFAPFLTELARTFSPDSLAGVSEDAMISWSTLETPDFRWAVSNALSGNLVGIVALVAWIALFVWLMTYFKKRNASLASAES